MSLSSSDQVRAFKAEHCPDGELLNHLFYIMHLTNYETVPKHKLLSRKQSEELAAVRCDISNKEVQALRADRKENIFLRCIHDYVPLYLVPQNPMLYKIREQHADLVILAINLSVLDYHPHLFSDGNAASSDTIFSENIEIIHASLPALTAQYWNGHPEGKRRRCVEALIYPCIGPGFIDFAYCSNEATASKVESIMNLRAKVNRQLFFPG